MPTEIERLYREHRAGLVRLVERELHDHHEAEDVVQTAFLDAQRALQRGTIPRNPSAWLATIALNAGRRLRRRRLNAEPLEEYAVQETLGVPEIRAALANLPREQRAAVMYRDLVGLSYGEMARQMGTSVNAVTMLLHRGRKRLRQTLGITAGGLGLWRWLKRAGMPQVAVAKGAAAVVVAASVATTGVVTARAVAPIGTHADATTTRSGVVLGHPSAHRQFMPAGDSRKSDARAQQRRASGGRTTASSQASTAQATTSVPARMPSVTLPSVPIPSAPVTVTISTPITAVTVTTPTVPAATVTTPIATVTVPIP
ncbi:MAG TPA: sigma-70 family RNA polymerase sigma factor [Nocardioidaceae bacterium]